MRFPYYEELQITHLFDRIRIKENMTKMLSKIIDGMRDKEKFVKICIDIQEVNHPMQSMVQSYIDGD